MGFECAIEAAEREGNEEREDDIGNDGSCKEIEADGGSKNQASVEVTNSNHEPAEEDGGQSGRDASYPVVNAKDSVKAAGEPVL